MSRLDETTAPLSDAEIERIRHEVEDRKYQPDRMNTVTLQVKTMRRLLATLDAYNEVRGQALADIARLADERDAARRALAALERDNAAMREIVAAVAATDVMCAECDMRSLHIHHTADCPVTRARALLGMPQTPATGATGEEGEA